MTTDPEITDEQRRAWRWIMRTKNPDVVCTKLDYFRVADALLIQTARVLRAEFERDHSTTLMRVKDDHPKLGEHCKKCGFVDVPNVPEDHRTLDPRHSYDWAQWLELANEELSR